MCTSITPKIVSTPAASLAQDPGKNSNYGFTLGVPSDSKVYDGRKKTFFFTNLDVLAFRQGILPGFGNTVPIPEIRQGNFSSLLNTANQVGTDVLGRPIFDEQILTQARLALRMVCLYEIRFQAISSLPVIR